MARLSLSSLTSIPAVQNAVAQIAASKIGRMVAPIAALMGLQDRSNSFILNIGDEGATLVQVRGGQVVDAVFAEAAAEEGWDALREFLNADPGARIVIVADVLEQMFREDTVPKVGILDRAKIVKRRLDLTFPNDILRAAKPLPRQKGAPQSVLFTALPMSPHLERWVTFLDEFPNPLSGFYMLPLEVIDILSKLTPSTEGESRRVWRALISQEAASGFRQIFESGGKLIVTRLTQRAAAPLTPEAEAMLIERELRSSISYIKRLGFSDADRLDVVVLADPAVIRAIDDRDLPATTVTTNTPYQAGVLLDLGEVGREDSPFADVLLGLWVAKKRKPSMTLPTIRIAQQMRMTSLLRWSAAGALALTLLSVYYTGSLIAAYVGSGQEIDQLSAQLTKGNARLATELDRVKSYPIHLDDLTQVAEVEKHLTRNELDVGATARKIGTALGGDGRVTKLTYELRQATGRAAGAKKTDPNAELAAYEIHIVVRFSSTADPKPDSQISIQRAKAILVRLAAQFPGSEVQAVRLPTDLAMNQLLEGTGSETLNANKAPGANVPTAEYVIRTSV